MTPEVRRDGWHWIAKQSRLDVYEKAMLWAIKSCQFRDRPVILDHAAIAQLSSMSRRQVIRCEERLEICGYLKVKRLGSRKPNSYQVVRLQGDLFDRGYVEHPVQNVGAVATARIPSVPASHNEPSKPPPCVPASHPISEGTNASVKEGSAVAFPKNRKEQEAAKESRVGTAPSPADLGVRVNEVAAERIRKRLGIGGGLMRHSGGEIQKEKRSVPTGRGNTNPSPPELLNRLRSAETIALRYHPKGEAIPFTMAQCEAAIRQAEEECPGGGFPKKAEGWLWYLQHPKGPGYKAINRARDLLFLWRIPV